MNTQFSKKIHNEPTIIYITGNEIEGYFFHGGMNVSEQRAAYTLYEGL